MKAEHKLDNKYVSAVLSTIFMGAGQLKNGQYIKGILFSLYQLLLWFVNFSAWKLELFPAFKFIKNYLGKLYTLGSLPGEDHSLFIMVKGSVAVVLLLGLLTIHIINIVDAYRNGKLIDQGQEVPDFKKSWHNMIDIGFPYFSITPGMIFLMVASIFPILFRF